LGDVKEVVAIRDGEGVGLVFFVYEGDCASAVTSVEELVAGSACVLFPRFWWVEMAVAGCGR
jgi:hypothetical protein